MTDQKSKQDYSKSLDKHFCMKIFETSQNICTYIPTHPIQFGEVALYFARCATKNSGKDCLNNEQTTRNH